MLLLTSCKVCRAVNELLFSDEHLRLPDAFAQSTGDSRPNTAPASVRATGSTSSRTGGSSSKPRNGGTSSSSTIAPTSATSSATSGASRAGQIQMNALTSILANMSESTAPETAADAANQPLDPHTIEVDLSSTAFSYIH